MLNQNMLLGGPVLALPMQEGAGATVYDISGFGNHGTITGATRVRLPSGLWYLKFDGDDKVAGTGNLLNPASSFTLLAWVNQSIAGGTIFSRVYADWPYLKFSFSTTQIILSGRNDANGAVSVYSSNGASLNAWHLVGISCNGSGTYRFFIDTAAYAQSGSTMTGTFGTNGWRLGVLSKNIDVEFLTGGIALPRIVPLVLADADVLTIFHREKHLLGIPVDWDSILARIQDQRELAVVR